MSRPIFSYFLGEGHTILLLVYIIRECVCGYIHVYVFFHSEPNIPEGFWVFQMTCAAAVVGVVK